MSVSKAYWIWSTRWAPQLVIGPPPNSLHRVLLGSNLDDPLGFASCIEKCPTLLDVKRQGLLGVDIFPCHASFDARSNTLELTGCNDHRIDIVSIEYFAIVGVDLPIGFELVAKRQRLWLVAIDLHRRLCWGNVPVDGNREIPPREPTSS